MRLYLSLILLCIGILGFGFGVRADPPSPMAKGPKDSPSVQVTADQSLEWYQEKRLYVARGGAKAIRGNMTVTADILTAHERDKDPNAPKQPKPAATDNKSNDAGDIDMMTADGHVVITDPRQRITGDHAMYDLTLHKMIVTGNNLRYETAKEVVTATDSLEYYEDSKLAIARGHAIADQPDRHIEGDVLTAEFRDAPNGQSQLTKMTAQGHVTVITKSKTDDSKSAAPEKGTTSNGGKKGGDISRGDHVVYDAGSNVAVLTGDVRVTRPDGTQLSGKVGEVDFNNNQSRLMDDGTSRVRALLPPKTAATTGIGTSSPPPPSAPVAVP